MIVSRHPSAIAFIREVANLSHDVPVLSEATAADVTGNSVYGNLPLHLACLCECVFAIEFAGAPPRGAEYGIEEMRAAGARITQYKVTAL